MVVIWPLQVDDAVDEVGRVGNPRDRVPLDDFLDVLDVETVVLVAERELEDANDLFGLGGLTLDGRRASPALRCFDR